MQARNEMKRTSFSYRRLHCGGVQFFAGQGNERDQQCFVVKATSLNWELPSTIKEAAPSGRIGSGGSYKTQRWQTGIRTRTGGGVELGGRRRV